MSDRLRIGDFLLIIEWAGVAKLPGRNIGCVRASRFTQAFLQQAQFAHVAFATAVGWLADVTTAVGADFGAAGRTQNCGPGPAVSREMLPARSAVSRRRRDVFMMS